jgi:hypothetical protein
MRTVSPGAPRPLVRAAALCAMLLPALLSAQEKLIGASTFSTGLLYDNWSFPTAVGTAGSDGAGMVSGASQLTVPIGLVIPLQPGWTVDAYLAYTRGTARLAVPDALGRSSYVLDGLTDTKVRLIGTLIPDAVMLTAGVNLPTGRAEFNGEQLGAFSVLSSTALRFRSPVLGTGAGATLGVILARSIADWGLALATTYEARGRYAPAQAAEVGAAPADLRVGNALHLSLAGERLLGSARHTVSLSSDIFQDGSIADPGHAAPDASFALGPSVAATYQVDATLGNVESTFFVVGRHRGEYRFGGESVPRSGRTELDGGGQMLRALTPSTALRLSIDLRYMNATSGLGGDSTATADLVNFATAGIRAVGLTVGMRHNDADQAWNIEPFLRAQVANLDFRTTTRTALGLSGGASLSTRF